MPVGHSTIYRAAWVCPVDQPPILNGYVQVSNGRITDLGRWNHKVGNESGQKRQSIVDLGNIALIPSLVNAHSHLEFSDLPTPLGHPGIEFTRWIEKVIQHRHDRGSNPSIKKNAIRNGISESIAAGVGMIGEIATTPLDLSDYQIGNRHNMNHGGSRIEITIFCEQLSRQPSRFNLSNWTVNNFLTANRWVNACGISPHAPYSVHPKLLQMLIATANRHQVPIAMHLAETEAERELLENLCGPFVELLQRLSVWNEGSFYPRSTIADYLQRLSTASRAIVVHGNYLRLEEIEFISRHRQRMAVVFCPRTHHFFRHADYPLKFLLQAGICVAIGTDSRASNPDLNLFSELQLIAKNFPELSPEQILELGTLNGAKALGVDADFGSLSVGKRALLSYISSDDFSSRSLDWVLDRSSHCDSVTFS